MQLAPAFTTYVQPFMAGTKLEKMTLSGRAHGTIEGTGASPSRIALQLEGAALELDAFSTGLVGVDGNIAWQASGDGADANLTHQLHADARLRVHVLQIVNELREVFDRINIVMRRR